MSASRSRVEEIATPSSLRVVSSASRPLRLVLAGGPEDGLVGPSLVDRRRRERGDGGQDLEVCGPVLDGLVAPCADDADPLASNLEGRGDERRDRALGGRGPGVGRHVVHDLGLALEDAAQDPRAGPGGGEAVGGRRRVVRRLEPAPGGAKEEEPGPSGWHAPGFAHRHGGDRRDLERRPDLVGEVVDEVQLAVALQGLLGERPLVMFARGRVAEDRRDRRRDALALDPADRLALEEDRVALAVGRDRAGRAGALAVEDDGALGIGDDDPCIGPGEEGGQHRRHVAMAGDEPAKIDVHRSGGRRAAQASRPCSSRAKSAACAR